MPLLVVIQEVEGSQKFWPDIGLQVAHCAWFWRARRDADAVVKLEKAAKARTVKVETDGIVVFEDDGGGLRSLVDRRQ